MLLSPWVWGTFLIGILFFFFIFTPTYIQTSAVETAVGAPSKNTRAGLSLTTLKNSLGEARMALGFLGILILIGIFLFFILEEFICWRHCHLETAPTHPHPVAFMNLVGVCFA